VPAATGKDEENEAQKDPAAGGRCAHAAHSSEGFLERQVRTVHV